MRTNTQGNSARLAGTMFLAESLIAFVVTGAPLARSWGLDSASTNQ